MATPTPDPSTVPAPGPSLPGTDPSTVSGLDPERLLAIQSAIDSLKKTYEEFARILKEEGAAAAIEYSVAFNRVNEAHMEAADKISGYSDALKASADASASVYSTLSRKITDQTREILAYGDSIEKLKKRQEELSVETVGFADTVHAQLKASRDGLDQLIDSLNSPLEKAGILTAVEDARAEVEKIFSEGGGAEQVAIKREQYFNQLLFAGMTPLKAREQADKIYEAVQAEFDLLASTEGRTDAEKAAIVTAVQLARANDALTKSTIELKDAQENLPAARLQKTLDKALEETNQGLTENIDKLTGATGKMGVFGSAALALAGGAGVGALSKSLTEGLARSFLDPEKAAIRMGNMINTMLIQSTLKFDETMAGVNKTTGGFADKFQEITTKGSMIKETDIHHLSMYGINLEKLGKTYGELAKSIGGFNNMSEKARKTLTEQAAILEKLGVSSGDYAQVTKYYMGSVGDSLEGVKKRMENLADAAIAAGKSVGEYVSEFNKYKSSLSGFGQEADTIFRNLNGMSQATKGMIDVGDLTKLADGFKDFESAGRSIQALNSALGGTSLNLLNVIGQDPAEIARQVKQAFELSHVEFDKLNIGMKRQLASLFGGDIGKAQAFFKMSMTEVNKQMGVQSEAEKERQKRIEASTSAMEKFQTAIDNMKMALTPMLKILEIGANIISSIAGMLGSSGTVFMGIVAINWGIKKIFSSLMGSVENMFVKVFTRVRTELAEVRAEAATPLPDPGGGTPHPSGPGTPSAPSAPHTPGMPRPLPTPPAGGGSRLGAFKANAKNWVSENSSMLIGMGVTMAGAALDSYVMEPLREKRAKEKVSSEAVTAESGLDIDLGPTDGSLHDGIATRDGTIVSTNVGGQLPPDYTVGKPKTLVVGSGPTAKQIKFAASDIVGGVNASSISEGNTSQTTNMFGGNTVNYGSTTGPVTSAQNFGDQTMQSSTAIAQAASQRDSSIIKTFVDSQREVSKENNTAIEKAIQGVQFNVEATVKGPVHAQVSRQLMDEWGTNIGDRLADRSAMKLT